MTRSNHKIQLGMWWVWQPVLSGKRPVSQSEKDNHCVHPACPELPSAWPTKFRSPGLLRCNAAKLVGVGVQTIQHLRYEFRKPGSLWGTSRVFGSSGKMALQLEWPEVIWLFHWTLSMLGRHCNFFPWSRAERDQQSRLQLFLRPAAAQLRCWDTGLSFWDDPPVCRNRCKLQYDTWDLYSMASMAYKFLQQMFVFQKLKHN